MILALLVLAVLALSVRVVRLTRDRDSLRRALNANEQARAMWERMAHVFENEARCWWRRAMRAPEPKEWRN